jgi:hypothetical protein
MVSMKFVKSLKKKSLIQDQIDCIEERLEQYAEAIGGCAQLFDKFLQEKSKAD